MAERVNTSGFHPGEAGAPTSGGSRLNSNPTGFGNCLEELHRVVHTAHVKMFISVPLEENSALRGEPSLCSRGLGANPAVPPTLWGRGLPNPRRSRTRPHDAGAWPPATRAQQPAVCARAREAPRHSRLPRVGRRAAGPGSDRRSRGRDGAYEVSPAWGPLVLGSRAEQMPLHSRGARPRMFKITRPAARPPCPFTAPGPGLGAGGPPGQPRTRSHDPRQGWRFRL